MNILTDLNIVLDYLITKRAGNPVAERLYKLLNDCKCTVWISSSSVDNLQYILIGEARRYGLDINYTMAEFRNYLKDIKLFSVTGKSIRMSLKAADLEDQIIYSNFKRIAPDGIVISNDIGFQNYPDVISPAEFMANHENLLKSKAVPMLNLKEEYRYAIEELDSAVLNSVAQTNYILGPEVKELETKIAEYLGVKHCIGASSGTEALVLSLRALAIKIRGEEYFSREDQIIATPFAFTATGDAILRSGATPVFVDIDPTTFNINIDEIRKYLSSSSSRQVVGILPVHLYGQSCQMDEIMDIAKEYNLFVVEDVAQAFGGTFQGKKLGSIGTTGCFSFFPSKNLGGFGDGGMVSTDDDEIADLVRMLIKHGGKDKYNVDHIGYNARLDTLQAGVLLAKFKYIDAFNERRRKIAEIYNKELANIEDLVLPSALCPLLFAFC